MFFFAFIRRVAGGMAGQWQDCICEREEGTDAGVGHSFHADAALFYAGQPVRFPYERQRRQEGRLRT